jgi:hypothetical protein
MRPDSTKQEAPAVSIGYPILIDFIVKVSRVFSFHVFENRYTNDVIKLIAKKASDKSKDTCRASRLQCGNRRCDFFWD